MQLEMEIETHSVSSEDQMKASIQFGIDSSELKNTEKYIILSLKRLLFFKDKVSKNPTIIQLWQELLSCLEERNRKLINIQNRSLIFTLFCPTDISLQQLQDEKWRIQLQERVDRLLKELGKYPMFSIADHLKIYIAILKIMKEVNGMKNIPRVTVLVFSFRCGTLNSNQSKICGYVMEFPFSYFNVLLGCDCKLLIMIVCIATGVG